jgi:hypothetical protein
VLHVSQDLVIGNGRKETTLWERIFEHYDKKRIH